MSHTEATNDNISDDDEIIKMLADRARKEGRFAEMWLLLRALFRRS